MCNNTEDFTKVIGNTVILSFIQKQSTHFFYSQMTEFYSNVKNFNS